MSDKSAEPDLTAERDIWRNAAQSLAADNARMCDIILAADKLSEAVKDVLASHPVLSRRLAKAIDAYSIVRQGQ